MSEYKKFCSQDFSNHELESQILKKVLKEMGLRGAKPYYFKSENGAFALPIVSPETKNNNKNDFGLRLYCLVLSESLVILLNGGIKSVSTSAQHCPNVSHFFNHAVALYNQINKARKDDLVRFKELSIEFDDNFFIDI